jgi:D-glutamate cyclase
VSTLSPFENLDRLITVEMRPNSLPQGYVPQFYMAARGTGDPLLYQLATELAALDLGRIAIFAGVCVPPHLEIGEMDGPLGAVVLAAALERIGHEAHIVVESSQVEAVQELCAIAEVPEIAVANAETVIDADVAGYAATLRAAVAIEKIAVNEQGVRHSLLGTRLDAMDDRPDAVFAELTRLGRLTVGIGDGGNEIGFGKLGADVRTILGATAECRCGCASGIVAATATTHLLPCAISNVGTYALTAALALVLDRPELAPRPDVIWSLLEGGLEAGLLDGGTLDPSFVGDDGVPGVAIRALVELLSTIVNQQSRELVERPF